MRKNLASLILLLAPCSTPPSLHAEKLPYFEGYCKYSGFKNQIHPDFALTTFNTWGLPLQLPGHDQKNRFNKINYFLLQTDSDVICLQETFNKKLRKKLISGLSSKYLTKSIKNETKLKHGLIAMDCQGGLLTLSIYPIIAENFFPFPDSSYSFIEKIGAKGVLWSIINVHGNYINILNTHLYAGDSKKAEKIRVNQLEYIKRLFDENPSFKYFPTVLAGDLNINHPDIKSSEAYNFITYTMNFLDSKPKIEAEDLTYSGKENRYIVNKKYNRKLDYAFIFDPSNALKTADSERVLHHIPISDHFGWKCRIYK